jgi:hypothetical protein
MNKPTIRPQGDTHYHTVDNVSAPAVGEFAPPVLDDPEGAREAAARVASIARDDHSGGFNPMARDPVTGELVHPAPRESTWQLPPQPTPTPTPTAKE